MTWTKYFGLFYEPHSAHRWSLVYFQTLGIFGSCRNFWEDVISPWFSHQGSSAKVCLFVLFLYWLSFVRCGRQKDSVILCRTYFWFLHLLVFRLEALGELWHSTKPLSRSVCPVQVGLVLFLKSLLRLTPDLCDGFCKTSFWSNWRLLLIHSHCWFHQCSVNADGIIHFAADSPSCALALASC